MQNDMPTPRTTPFAFISLLFLLLHVLVPAIALPVESRPSLSRSLDTPSVQHDTTLLKRLHVTSLDTPSFSSGSSPDSAPIAHNSRPSNRLFAHTFLDPHALAHIPSPSLQHSDTTTGYRVAPKLDRRWWLFDKIKEGFQNFGKKVKDGFQTAGRKIKEGFQNFGNKVKQGFQKVKTAFQTAGQKIKQGFQTFGNKVKQGFQKVGKAFQTVGKKIKQGFQTFGTKVKQGFQKVKEGFQTAGRKIKEGFQTAGRKMKEGFIKAGNWIKDTGAKAAKFGLKVWSTVQSVGARVVKYILPGIGKPISAALEASSEGISTLADKIPVKLDGRLEKGMQIMDRIQHPLSGAAGAVVDKILRRDFPPTSAELFERDFIEENELSRRDLHELDERAWDGDFDIVERSWNDDSNLPGHSVSGDDARSFHVVGSKRPLFRKDP